jgi:hypothetical protein
MKRIITGLLLFAALTCAAGVYLGTQRINIDSGITIDERAVVKRYLGDQLIFEASASEEVLLTPAMTSATTPAPFVVAAALDGVGDSSQYPSWKAFDQNISTIAHSSQPTGRWISVDLGQARHVTRVEMYSRGDGAQWQQDTPNTVSIQYSPDNSTWNTFSTISDIPIPSANYSLFLDEDVDFSTRYFRVLMDNTRGRGFVVLSEIKIYGH